MTIIKNEFGDLQLFSYGTYPGAPSSSSIVPYLVIRIDEEPRVSYSSYPYAGYGPVYKTNPYSKQVVTISDRPTIYQYWKHYWKNNRIVGTQYDDRRIINTALSYQSSINPPIGTYADEAARRFYDNLNRMKTMAAVSFVEKQKSLDLVANAATRIFRSLVSLKSGRLHEAFIHLTGQRYSKTKSLKFNGLVADKNKPVSSNWLAFQYGWQPLYQEVYGTMISFHNERPTFWVAGYADAKVKKSHFTITDIKASIKYKALCSYNPTTLKLHELGLLNPAGVAWELVPFSFVVDWFLPIGDYISSVSTTVGLSMTERSATSNLNHYVEKHHFITEFTSRRGYGYSNKTKGVQTLRFVAKNRSVGNVATPTINFPEFDLGLSTGQAINGLALLFSFRK